MATESGVARTHPRRTWAVFPGWRALLLDPATVLGLCLVVAIALRLHGINLVHTSDEGLWMLRSLGFGSALTRGDYAATYQSGHPGVTVMWTGYLGIGRDRLVSFLLMRFPDFRAAQIGPGYLELFGYARQSMALVTAALITLAIGLAWRLLGRAGLVGGLLLLLDPYVAGMTRLLHVDALLAPLMTVSALAGLIWWQDGRWRYLLLSAVSGGLALLTKAPAVYLPMVVGLAGLWAVLSGHTRGRGRRAWVTAVIVWGVVAGATYVALWPSMWVDPAGTMLEVADFARTVGGQPHRWSNFFWGEPITQDPGPLYYPVSLALRLGPVVFVGVILAAVLGRRSERRSAVIGMVVYALGFVALMTLGGKKFDRYMLPTIVMFDLLAGVGLWEAARLLRRRDVLAGVSFRLRWVILAVAVAVQAAFCWMSYPYPLVAYNPLLGGTATARQALLVGWGEGLDQVADYLNARPNAQRLAATTLYHHVMRPVFAGQTARIGDPGQLDYFVVYVNMEQRGLVPAPIRQVMAEGPPEFVARVNGVEYAWVYRVPRGVQVPALEQPVEGLSDDNLRVPRR
jgi:hypothetical protein